MIGDVDANRSGGDLVTFSLRTAYA
jgi:hypothetical protein